MPLLSEKSYEFLTYKKNWNILIMDVECAPAFKVLLPMRVRFVTDQLSFKKLQRRSYKTAKNNILEYMFNLKSIFHHFNVFNLFPADKMQTGMAFGSVFIGIKA